MPLPPFQTDPRTQKLPPQLAIHPLGFDATGWHYAQGEKTFGPVLMARRQYRRRLSKSAARLL